MKQLVKILICVSVFQYATAQKYIEKAVETKAQLIEIYLDEIDNLTLESSKNAKVSVELKGDDFALNAINISEEKSTLIIRADNPPLFQDQINKFCVDQPTIDSYKIIVPQGLKVRVNITRGNLLVKHFKGDLRITIETGFVELNKIEGDVNLSIIDGSVIAKLESASINVNSNLGKVHSDLSLKEVFQTENSYKGMFVNSKQKLFIKAIKANIYLEQAKD